MPDAKLLLGAKARGLRVSHRANDPEGGGLTCHYGAHQKKDAEEYVSRQRAEAVHDLPLADGEENSKHLPTSQQSGAGPLGILSDRAAQRLPAPSS